MKVMVPSTTVYLGLMQDPHGRRTDSWEWSSDLHVCTVAHWKTKFQQHLGGKWFRGSMVVISRLGRTTQ